MRPDPIIGRIAILAKAIGANRPRCLVLVGLGIQRHKTAVGAEHGDLDGIEERTLATAVGSEQAGDLGNADVLSFVQEELDQVDAFKIFHASSSSVCSGP